MTTLKESKSTKSDVTFWDNEDGSAGFTWIPEGVLFGDGDFGTTPDHPLSRAKTIKEARAFIESRGHQIVKEN